MRSGHSSARPPAIALHCLQPLPDLTASRRPLCGSHAGILAAPEDGRLTPSPGPLHPRLPLSVPPHLLTAPSLPSFKCLLYLQSPVLSVYTRTCRHAHTLLPTPPFLHSTSHPLMYYLFFWFIVCLRPAEFKFLEGRDLGLACSSLHPWCLEQCVAHSRHPWMFAE